MIVSEDATMERDPCECMLPVKLHVKLRMRSIRAYKRGAVRVEYPLPVSVISDTGIYDMCYVSFIIASSPDLGTRLNLTPGHKR